MASHSPCSLCLLLLTLASGSALSQPAQGTRLPPFRAADLRGQEQTHEDLRGRPTLLVAITESGGEEAMRRWLLAAATQAPREVRCLAIASLQLPFLVSDGMVRREARRRTPTPAWADTFVDSHGQLARALGLAPSPLPYVLALDARGHVLRVFHGAVDAPGAQALWRAWQEALDVSGAPALPPAATPPPPPAAPPTPPP